MFPFVSVPHLNHCLLYSQLLCFYIFIYTVHSFLRLFSVVSFPTDIEVVLLLAAVRFPFLIHARTNLVFALLFCQPCNVVSWHRIPRTVSFLILSRLVMPPGTVVPGGLMCCLVDHLLKIWEGKNCPIFGAISDKLYFDREYIGNGSRYQHAKNGVSSCCTELD